MKLALTFLVAAFVCFTVAAFRVSVSLGLAVAGVQLLAAGVALVPTKGPLK